MFLKNNTHTAKKNFVLWVTEIQKCLSFVKPNIRKVVYQLKCYKIEIVSNTKFKASLVTIYGSQCNTFHSKTSYAGFPLKRSLYLSYASKDNIS